MNQLLRRERTYGAGTEQEARCAVLPDSRRWATLLAVLLLTPFTAVWLMQLAYGVPPWAMPLPAAAANALCIALLYWPLCGLTGQVRRCCCGIHIAAGAWGAGGVVAKRPHYYIKYTFKGSILFMEITKKDVELAAKLAKMRVSEQEAAIYQEQLEALFKWVKELSAVNTDSVRLRNVNHCAHMRPDTAVTNPALAAELRGAFDQEQDQCAKVKKVL